MFLNKFGFQIIDINGISKQDIYHLKICKSTVAIERVINQNFKPLAKLIISGFDSRIILVLTKCKGNGSVHHLHL